VVDVDACGKHLDAYNIAADAQHVVRSRLAAHMVASEATEIRLIQFRLEAENVIFHEGVHEPFVLRHGEEKVGRRKWNMKEKPNPVAHAARPQSRRQRDEMIIMGPDEIVEGQLRRQYLG